MHLTAVPTPPGSDLSRSTGPAHLRKQVIEIFSAYNCPNYFTAGIDAYRRENSWHNPGPDIMMQAAKDAKLGLAACWRVGDDMPDMQAALPASVSIHPLYYSGATESTRDVWRLPGIADATEILTSLSNHVL